MKSRKSSTQLLLGRGDVNLNMPDNSGQTPLLLAASNGHDGVIKLLLGQEDVNPDFPDNNSVRNRPGALRGPAGGLPRAPDGTGRLAVVHPVRPKGRTVVFG